MRATTGELHQACRALLPGYDAARDERQRVALLTRACLSRALAARDCGSLPGAAAAFDPVAHAVSAGGPRAIDTLIVSGAEAPSSVLCALWLARRSGLFQPPRGPAPGPGRASALDVVPRFERQAALERAPTTMGFLYSNAAYAEHLLARRDRQQVILDHSDNGGTVDDRAGRRVLHRARERLARQATERGIQLRLVAAG